MSPADNFYGELLSDQVFKWHRNEEEYEERDSLADRPEAETAEKNWLL